MSQTLTRQADALRTAAVFVEAHPDLPHGAEFEYSAATGQLNLWLHPHGTPVAELMAWVERIAAEIGASGVERRDTEHADTYAATLSAEGWLGEYRIRVCAFLHAATVTYPHDGGEETFYLAIRPLGGEPVPSEFAWSLHCPDCGSTPFVAAELADADECPACDGEVRVYLPPDAPLPRDWRWALELPDRPLVGEVAA